MKIALIPNYSKSNAVECTQKVIEEILRLGSSILMLCESKVYFKDYKLNFYAEMDDIISLCDIVITIGGDGTIIHAAKCAAKNQKPILGINLGRIGFVAGLETTEIHLINNIIKGKYKTEKRMMLDISIIRDGLLRSHFCALNDAVVSKGTFSGVADLNVTLNENKMTEYIADGLIFATPTGSTAYSLSAGGPVIEPTIKCIILTPICQHSIFSRSVIFDSDSKLSVGTNIREKNEVVLSIDGQEPIIITEKDTINIKKSDLYVELINLKNNNFYEVLNSKLAERRI